MKTTKEQRDALRRLIDPIREGQWVRGRGDSAIVDARTGETIFEAGPQSSDDPADPRGWIARLVDAILAIRNTGPDLIDDIEEAERERHEMYDTFKALGIFRVDHAGRKRTTEEMLADIAAPARCEAERRIRDVLASVREDVRQAKIAGVKEGIRLALEQMKGDPDVETARLNIKLLQGDEEGIANAIAWPR